MGYIEEIKNSKRKLNIMYGMIGENDLSDEEKALKLEVEGWLKDENMTASELVNKLDAESNEIKKIMDNPDKVTAYFNKLIGQEDKEALAIQKQVQDAEKVLANSLNKIRAAAVAKDNAFRAKADAEKELKSAKADYNKQAAYKEKAYENAVAAARKKFDASQNKLTEIAALKEKYEALLKKSEELDVLWDTYDKAKKSFPENSKEYKEYEKLAKNYDKEYKKAAKETNAVRDSYKKLEAEVKNVDHKAVYDAEMVAIEEQYKANDAKLTELNAVIAEKQAALDEAELNYNFAEASHKAYEDDIISCKKNLDGKNGIASNYAKTRLALKNKAIIEKMGNVTDYEDIDAALKNTKPRVTDETIAKGLAEVKKAYQCFKQKHWGITRMFRKMGLGETGREYTAFSSLRTKFIRYTGMRQADVDKYLDDGVLQGTLKTHCEKYDIHPETIMTKNYAKCAGVSQDVYAAHVVSCYKNVLFNPAVKSGPAVMLVKVEEGLKMLSALGAQNRKSHSQALTSAINEIKEDLTAKGMEYGFEATIETEVSNALKKPADRVPVNRSLNSSYTAYTNVVKAMEKENDKDDNAVLIRRDAKHYPEAYANSEVTVHMEAPKDDPKQVAVELDENAEVNEDMQAGKGLEKNLVFQKA